MARHRNGMLWGMERQGGSRVAITPTGEQFTELQACEPLRNVLAGESTDA